MSNHNRFRRIYWVLALLSLATAAHATSSKTICVAGSTTITNSASCSIPPAGLSATASAAAWGGMSASVMVSAIATSLGPLTALGNTSTALADASSWFTSAGPARLGSITMQSFLLGDSAGVPLLYISDGVHTYSPFCMAGGPSCSQTQTVPFDLGVPFMIVASAGALADTYTSMATSQGTLTFSLYDANGALTGSTLMATPEPASASLALIAALVFAAVRFRPSRKTA